MPATPGWTVRDVIAHLVGIGEDGPPPAAGPDEQWTAGHVAARRGMPVDALLDRWAAAPPGVAAFADSGPVWPPVLDVGTHELDLRAAFGDRSGRDSDLVRTAASVLIASLRVPVPLVVRTELQERRVGPDEGGTLLLTTTAYEVFRWRMGRRSRAQLAAMDWSGDPSPVLEQLYVFGPADHDLVE